MILWIEIDIVNHIFQNDFIELILAVQYYMVRQDNNAHLYFGHFIHSCRKIN